MGGTRAPTSRRDAGQAAVLMAGVLVVTAALVVGLTHMVLLMAGHQQAQAAADAAALAGVSGGPEAARAVAAANGARVMALEYTDDDLTVRVEVELVRGPWHRTVGAVARATRAP